MKDESGCVARVVCRPGLLERLALQLPGRHLGRDGDGDAVVPRLGVQVHEHHHLTRNLERENQTSSINTPKDYETRLGEHPSRFLLRSSLGSLRAVRLAVYDPKKPIRFSQLDYRVN